MKKRSFLVCAVVLGFLFPSAGYCNAGEDIAIVGGVAVTLGSMGLI